MEKVQKNIDEELQFWNAIGPFMTLLTVMVCLIKGSQAHTAFAVVGLIGIPLCVRWQKKGMLLSLALLLAVLLYQVPPLSLDQQVWSGGVFLAFSLSFFATALSFEEGSSLITKMVTDANTHLDQLRLLDDKIRSVQKELIEERAKANTQLKAIELEAAQYKEKVESTQVLADAAQQELSMIYERNKTLLEELFEAKSKAANAAPPEELQSLTNKLHQEEERALTLELHLEEKEAGIKQQTETLVSLQRQLLEKEEGQKKELEVLTQQLHDFTQQIQEKNNQLHEKQKIAEDAQQQHLSFTQEIDALQQQIEQIKAEESIHQESIVSLKEQLTTLQSSLDAHQKQLAEKDVALQVHAQEIEQLQSEKEALKLKKEKTTTTAAKKETAAYRKLQGMFKQLKEQFDEKCSVLDETRRAQFHMQERLFNAQRELEEKQRIEKNEAEALLEKHLLKIEEERKEYLEEIDSLQQIIATMSKK